MDNVVTFATETPEGANPVELIEADGKRTLRGYCIVWGAIARTPIQHPDKSFRRYVFERGSITWAAEVFAVFHHDAKIPLATTSNGTLRMIEDEIGVLVEIDLDETTDGNNAYIRAKSRLMRGMSFGGAMPTGDVQTETPGVYRVAAPRGNMLAGEVTVTITPRMPETTLAVKDSEADKKNSAAMKERAARMQKNKLDQYKLATYDRQSIGQRGR